MIKLTHPQNIHYDYKQKKRRETKKTNFQTFSKEKIFERHQSRGYEDSRIEEERKNTNLLSKYFNSK